MDRKINFFFIYIFTFVSIWANAQKPDVVKYRGCADFSATTIHDIVQDSVGYIWIASSQGLYRFDGTRFKKFGLDLGISNSDARALFVASDSSLWVTTANAETWRINNDIVYKQKMVGGFESAGVPLHASFIEENDTISFYTMDGQLYCFKNDSLVRHAKPGHSAAIVSLLNHSNNPLLRKLSFFIQLNFDNWLKNKDLVRGNICFCVSKKQADLYAGNLRISVTDKDLFHQFLDEEVLDIKPFDSLVLKSIYGKGLLLCDESNQSSDTLIHDAVVTRIFVDKNKGVWLGTLNCGLFYIRNIYARSFLNADDPNKGRYADMIRVGDSVLAICGNQLLYIGDKQKKNKVLIQLPFKPEQMSYAGHKRLVVYNLRQIVSYRNVHGQWVKDWDRAINQLDSRQLVVMGGKVFVAGARGLWVIENGKNEQKIDALVRIRFLVKFRDEVYAASDSELWIIDKHGQRKIYPLSEPLTYLGADEKHLYMRHKIGSLSVLTNFDDEVLVFEGYSQINNVVSCENNIYISTGSNLYVQQINDDSSLNHTVHRSSHIVGSANILKTECSNRALYVLHENGITVLSNKIRQTHKQNIVVSCNLPIERIDKGYKVVLDKNQSHVHLDFSDFDYSSMGVSEYYFTINNDTTRNFISNNQLDLVNIRRGVTRINITPSSTKYEHQSSVEIEIYKKSFWHEEVWLQLSVGVLIFILVVYILHFIIKRVKRHEKLKNTKVAQMQIVLQQQMNPHFIFNSLTSINHFILQNKPMESSRYLIKFSTLIRSILDNSDESYVNLSSETEVLDGYLQLELLRFKGRFSYRIEIDPNLNKRAICVPPFIIHPFVERALREGVINRDDKGLIIIRFTQHMQNLVCSIIDNGVGMAMVSKENNKKVSRDGKSGTQIAKQRIDLYNATHRRKITLMMDDAFDHAGNVTGTNVFLSFPIKKC